MGDGDFLGRVIIFSIDGCTHCLSAKETLQKLGVPFNEVAVDQYDTSVRTDLFERSRQRSLPQIFFNHRFIGGNDELNKLVADEAALSEAINLVRHEPPGPGTPNVPDSCLLINRDSFSDAFPEPDEYGLLVRDMKSEGVVKDIRRGFTKYTNSFTGHQLVDWLVDKKSISRERAVLIGQALVSRHFGHSLPPDDEEVFHDDDTIYRLLEDDESDALNSGPTPNYEPRPAHELSREIHRTLLSVLSEHVASDGKRIDYTRISESEEFRRYIKLTCELQCVDIASATRDQKIAFFVNIYNALVIHANIVKGPPTNVFQRWKFFNTVRYVIGGYAYTLQDIENGVLRANSRGVAQLFRPFGSHDPRLRVALKEPEALIHFALVCGAKSCPPVRVYDVDKIEDQLLISTQAFLESEEVSINDSTVTLSMIFKWYRQDFGRTDQEVLSWIESKMADGPKRESLRSVLKNDHFRIAYKPYDWSSNAKYQQRPGPSRRQLYGKASCHVATIVFYVVVSLTLIVMLTSILIFWL